MNEKKNEINKPFFLRRGLSLRRLSERSGGKIANSCLVSWPALPFLKKWDAPVRIASSGVGIFPFEFRDYSD